MKTTTCCSYKLIIIICMLIGLSDNLVQGRAWKRDIETTLAPALDPQVDHDVSNQNHNHIPQQKTAAINPSYHFDVQVNPYMQAHKLSPTSNNITCNDGSQVGYYMRLNKHSKSWIIYLQGGGFCGNEESCQQRWQSSAHLMSSNYWPKTKTVEGILSNEPKENPYLWNANHIYIPYCSSDSWTGLAQASQNNTGSSFAFMGSKIIERVLDSLFDDLPRDSSLYEAKFILLAGDSAGATGVILNLDKVNAIVQQRASSFRTNCASTDDQSACDSLRQPPVLRGLADSGWFLDNEPYDFGRGELYANEAQEVTIDGNEDCNRQRCTPLQSIRQAKLFWNGQVPASCANQYPLEPWRCYFGYRAYQTLNTPLFVVQWLYDEAQLLVDNIARPDTNGQWNYVNKVVHEMRTSLENVTALFAPSCFSHSLIVRKSWNQININGFKLPHVLNSWEEQSLLVTTTTAIEPTQMNNNAVTSGASQVISSNVGEQQIGLPPLIINSSLPSIVNQPTFETVLVEQETQSSSPMAVPQFGVISHKDIDRITHTQSPYELRHANSHRNQPTTNSANSNRSQRTRKRKRNNHQQRTKQTRQQKPQATTEIVSPTTTNSDTRSQSYFSSTNDLVSSANPLQDLLPLIDRSLASANLLYGRLNRNTSGLSDFNNGRLGRSTIVDDTTLMQSNNVPDDNPTVSSTATQNLDYRLNGSTWPWSSLGGNGFIPPNKHPKANRFRLIDSCGWPQCNRDCPVLGSELSLGGLIQF